MVVSPATVRRGRFGAPGSPGLRFQIWIYLGTLSVRLIVSGAIYHSGHVSYFAGDSWTYDFFGYALSRAWSGELQHPNWLLSHTGQLGMNGMYYWVAAIYTVFGRSEVLASAIQSAITSLIPVLAYKITLLVYESIRAARCAALLTAFLPSMVIWSSLLLKDAPVAFLACLTVYCSLKVQIQLKLQYLVPGFLALLLIFPLRGYVFYFLLLAMIGTLLISHFGRSANLGVFLARIGVLVAILAALFALDFDRIAKQQLNTNLLEMVQRSRMDLARTAQSGFDRNSDVSRLSSAIAYLPKGIAFLLFSPFPWQAGSPRAMLALPETLLWYGLFPFCLAGMFHTARHHLREALIIFLFVIQLTCFYGIFIGNVGTAHRQRTQVSVFYLIFTAVGFTSWRNRRAPDSMATRLVPDSGEGERR
jgi:4-amino-4-deoxy-L-arabinose transferase-like glycosyltransferase